MSSEKKTGSETDSAAASGPGRRTAAILLAVLTAAFLVQSHSASLGKSPVWDEPGHIGAGLTYVSTGQILINPQHPPLLKEISGLFQRLGGVRLPADYQALLSAKGVLTPDRAVGNAVLANSGPDKVLFWSRLPLILLATALCVILYALGSRLLGVSAALGSVLLYAFDPNILAHSFLVTTDVGIAVFVVWYLLALWNWVRAPSRGRMVWCGVALGAALGAKFSAAVLPPLSALLLVAAVRWPAANGAGKAKALAPPAGRNAPCPCGSGKKYKNCHERGDLAARAEDNPWRRLLHYAAGLAGIGVVAFAVLEIIYLFPRDPFQYLDGLRQVNADHDPNYLVYMAGHLAPRFYSYYLVAYLLKEPIASLVLAGVGLFAVVRSKTIPPLARAFVLVPPAALFAGYTLLSDNLGIRYIIPALPFMHLLGGAGLASLIQSGSRWRQGAAALLCLWLVAAAAGIYPDHLSYFNEMACVLDDPGKLGLDGGSRCGVSWLDDSNIDWGQGLKQLKSWLDRNEPGKRVRLGYFGIFPPDGYGILQEPVDVPDLVGDVKPGLYAVSSHLVAGAPAIASRVRGGGGEWLRSRPLAIVGHAYYIFQAGGGQAQQGTPAPATRAGQ